MENVNEEASARSLEVLRSTENERPSGQANHLIGPRHGDANNHRSSSSETKQRETSNKRTFSQQSNDRQLLGFTSSQESVSSA